MEELIMMEFDEVLKMRVKWHEASKKEERKGMEAYVAYFDNKDLVWDLSQYFIANNYSTYSCSREPLLNRSGQIGRASCRERV